MLGRDEEARDVCQEAFLSAYRNLNKFRGDAKFSSWLYRIALNCCHVHLRHRSNSEFSLEQQLEEQGFEVASGDEAMDGDLQRYQIAAIVRRALACLPPEMREVIIMKEYQELKFHEIAEILDIPLSTVKTRVYTGLNQLKQRLSHLKSAL
jgi:RNA polymerase sigma-70 factor (ECF subfamily)